MCNNFQFLFKHLSCLYYQKLFHKCIKKIECLTKVRVFCILCVPELCFIGILTGFTYPRWTNLNILSEWYKLASLHSIQEKCKRLALQFFSNSRFASPVTWDLVGNSQDLPAYKFRRMLHFQVPYHQKIYNFHNACQIMSWGIYLEQKQRIC